MKKEKEICFDCGEIGYKLTRDGVLLCRDCYDGLDFVTEDEE